MPERALLVTVDALGTRDVGRRLGAAARPGDAFLLDGELGSGKTVLVQGLADGLGATTEVQSPTFVLVRQYPGRLELVHADLYRLEERREVDGLDLLELSADGVLAVEWAERAPWLDLPLAARLRLGPGDGQHQRRVELISGPAHLRQAFAAP